MQIEKPSEPVALADSAQPTNELATPVHSDDSIHPTTEPTTSSQPLRGLRALVTGSTRGIGRAIAGALANAGADVIVHGRRPPEGADEQFAAIGIRCRMLTAG